MAIEMTEAEAIEALSNIAINVTAFFSIFISITFAYLTVAYLVGRDLSRFQLTAINSLYVLCTLLMGAATAGWNEAWIKLHSREATVISDIWIIDAIAWTEGLYLMLASIVFASIYFMYDIRKQNRK